MPLIVSQFNDRYAPIIVCDHCMERIDDARDGNYHWAIDEDKVTPLTGEILFTHKRCFAVFDAGQPKEALGRGIEWGTMGLDSLLVYLLHNVRVHLTA